MKKFWLPLLVVGIWLVIFVIGPFYAGGKVEEKLDTLLTNINSNGILVFEKTSYEKGLMSSDLVLTMTMNTEMFAPAMQQFGGIPKIEPVLLKGEVKHGPFLIDSGFEMAVGRINLVPDIDAEHLTKISEVFATETPLNFSVQFNWDKSIIAEGSLVGFSMADKGVKSSEVTFSSTITDDGNHLVSSFNWDGLSINDPQQENSNFAISKISSESDQVQVIEEIWVGKGNFAIKKIEFNESGMSGLVDNIGMKVTTSADEANAFMDGVVNLSVAKVAVAGVDYVEDLEYSISFKHIQIEALQKIAKAMKEAQQSGGSPEAMQMAMGMQLMGTLPEIVNQGFTINIDALNAKVLGEQITSKLSIEIAQGTDVSAGMSAIAGVSMSADVSISKALLSKIPTGFPPEMIQGLVAQGLIIEENGLLKSHAEFKAGQLTVNGKPMPIPGL